MKACLMGMVLIDAGPIDADTTAAYALLMPSLIDAQLLRLIGVSSIYAQEALLMPRKLF